MGLGFMGLTDLGFRVSTVSIVVPFRRFLIGSYNPRHIYIYITSTCSVYRCTIKEPQTIF